jgi:hypothetical protein
MGKKDEEENGVLDTIGDAATAVGEFLFKGGRDFSEEGLKEMAKEKPKKVKAKPKPKPQKVSEITQRAESPSGFKFGTVTQTDNRTSEMKEQPPTPINTGLTEAQIRNKRIQKRIDALRKRKSND